MQPLWFHSGRRLYATKIATNQDDMTSPGNYLYLSEVRREWVPRENIDGAQRYRLLSGFTAVLLPEGAVLHFRQEDGVEFSVAMDNPAWFPYGYLDRRQYWTVSNIDPNEPMAAVRGPADDTARASLDLIIYDCSLRISLGRVVQADVIIRENLRVRGDQLEPRMDPRIDAIRTMGGGVKYVMRLSGYSDDGDLPELETID